MAVQWSLVLFTALSGCGAWLFTALAVAELRGQAEKTPLAASAVAVVLMALGGVASATHLSHVDRIFAVLAHPAPGIFLEALLLGITAIVVAVYAVAVRRGATPPVRKGLAAAGGVLAVVFAVSCGASYMMASRPAWDTVLLPLAYAGTSAAAGTGLYLALAAALKEPEDAVRNAGLYAVGGGVISLVLGLAYGFVSGIALGEQALLFWLGVPVVGGAVPLGAGAMARRSPESGVALGAAACIGGFIGSVVVRVVMWMVGAPIVDYFGIAL